MEIVSVTGGAKLSCYSVIQEDAKLCELVAKYGPRNWGYISQVGSPRFITRFANFSTVDHSHPHAQEPF